MRFAPFRLVVLFLLAVAVPAVAERREGELVLYHLDDFEHGRSTIGYRLRESGQAKATELSFAAPPHLRSGARVVVDGAIGANDVFFVDGAALAAGVAAATSVPPPSGDQRTAVFLLDFNDATNNCTLTGVENLLFGPSGSVKALYEESSFGKLSFSGKAFGPFHIDDYRSQHCNPFGWAYEANQKAAAAGVSLAAYTRFVYLIATNPSWTCNWGGISETGVTPSESIVEGYNQCGYVQGHAHELGHAIGMQHASSDLQDDGVIDDEYGDYSDVMGGSYEDFPHHNAPHKLEMAWIAPSNTAVVTGNARVAIRPLETAPAPDDTVALRVAKPGTLAEYFVSLRRGLGQDSTLPTTFVDALSIHAYGGWSYLGDHTALVGAVPPTQSFRSTGFALTYLASSASGAFVEVAFSCEAFPPVIDLPPSTLVVPGGQVAVPLTIHNDDTVLCDASGFSVAASAPAGWTAVVSTPRTTLAAKASGTLQLTLTSPADATEGTYPVDVRVTDPSEPAHARTIHLDVSVKLCREGCETCGNGSVDPGEECDNGDMRSGDGCDTNCTSTRCGNGITTSGEDCDDGNLTSGDGCSSACQRECAVAATCSDGDPCNTDTCEDGLCRYAEPTDYAGAICLVSELDASSLCAGVAVPKSLRTLLAQSVAKVVKLLDKARASANPKRVRILLKRCGAKLVVIERKARKLVSRGKLDEGCGARIVEEIGRPKAVVTALDV